VGNKQLPDLPEIIQGCKEGNKKCYEMLYKSYYGYVMGIALRYVINYEMAEESTNDCFMKVFSNIRYYAEEKNFKTWIRRIAINTCIDSLRKEKRFSHLNDEKVNESFYNEPVIENLDYEFVLTLLKRLPVMQRLVFNLYDIRKAWNTGKLIPNIFDPGKKKIAA
jgi:RNA polymerase sigma-70 factor (ECF subfamily)